MIENIRIKKKKKLLAYTLAKEVKKIYPLPSEYHIYSDYPQSTHTDSSPSERDLYPWKDNTLKEHNTNMSMNLITQGKLG